MGTLADRLAAFNPHPPVTFDLTKGPIALEAIAKAKPEPIPGPSDTVPAITLDQIKNLTALLEGRFPYFHAGPKFWRQAQTEWAEFTFEQCAAGILKAGTIDRRLTPTLLTLTANIRNAAEGKA